MNVSEIEVTHERERKGWKLIARQTTANKIKFKSVRENSPLLCLLLNLFVFVGRLLSHSLNKILLIVHCAVCDMAYKKRYTSGVSEMDIKINSRESTARFHYKFIEIPNVWPNGEEKWMEKAHKGKEMRAFWIWINLNE